MSDPVEIYPITVKLLEAASYKNATGAHIHIHDSLDMR